MKKNIYLIVAALFCVVGCQVQEQKQKQMDPVEAQTAPERIYAEIEQLSGNDTKTYIGDNDFVYFQTNDQINLFSGNISSQYQIAEGDNGNTSGTFNKISSEEISFGIDGVVACYPYNKNIKIESTDDSFNITGITFPSVQNYDLDHYISQNALPMISANTADADIINLKNLCGVLELRITGTDRVTSISIRSNQGEQICGDASVTAKPGKNPSISMTNPVEGETNEVVLNCCVSNVAKGVQLDKLEPTTFRIVLPPVTFAKGFTIKVRTGNKFMVQKTNKEITIERSQITPMSNFTYNPDPENKDGITGIAIDLVDLGNDVTFDMIRVEAGTFTMGGTGNEDLGLHDVTITQDYYIGETEVVQSLWQAVMGSNPSDPKGKIGDQYPVNNVCWYDICADNMSENYICFLSTLNATSKTGVPAGMTFVLPTEAQWEYAARGGKRSNGYKFSGSNNAGEVAWYSGNSKVDGETNAHFHLVGQKLPNELGIYDMSGNVLEWCYDWYDRYYYTNSQSNYDPIGPDTGEWRVMRGGCYSSYSDSQCSVFNRSFKYPNNNGRAINLGFRLVLVSSTPSTK